jgi:hypothetical protein
VGNAMLAQFSTLSSYIITNTSQFSTLSTLISSTSVEDKAYASTIAFSTASTLVTRGISSLLSTGGIFTGPLWVSSLAVGYKAGMDISGTIDTNGLIYAAGLRGLSSPFSIGVGKSSIQSLVGQGYTSSIGWRMSLIGDIDISGLLYRNGQLYTIQGQPDVYWSKNGSNIWFAGGNVGIGVTNPSYPLDVAGRIRCFGVDVIPGPGPMTSTGQGVYVSPWVYQGSNIYYNLGGAGIGTGISSVLSGVAWDVSGPIRIRNGPTYMSSLGVNIPYGSTLTAAADILGSLRAQSLQIDTTGTFKGRVTAKDFLSLSDRRFKDNIELISNAEIILSSIRGVRFQWKHSEITDVGCIAQDVAAILPEAVSGTVETGLHLAYDKLVPVLIEAVKNLTARVEYLEKRLPA